MIPTKKIPHCRHQTAIVWAIVVSSCGRVGYQNIPTDIANEIIAPADNGVDVPQYPDVFDAFDSPDTPDIPIVSDATDITDIPDAPDTMIITSVVLNNQLGAWGTPTLVPVINSAQSNDDDPTLTSDMLEIYFNSDRSGNAEIWFSTRASVSDPWSAPALVTGVNTTNYESSPEISPDGLTLWFTSNRGGPQQYDIWRATRTSRQSPWTTAVRVTEFASSGHDQAPVLFLTGLSVIYNSDQAGTTDQDIYIGNRASLSDPFGQITRVTELSSMRADHQPFIFEDGLLVFWDSNRTGNSDIYVASRNSTTEAFSNIQTVPNLSTTSEDQDVWLSPDLRRIYFSSTRMGSQHLFESSR